MDLLKELVVAFLYFSRATFNPARGGREGSGTDGQHRCILKGWITLESGSISFGLKSRLSLGTEQQINPALMGKPLCAGSPLQGSWGKRIPGNLEQIRISVV